MWELLTQFIIMVIKKIIKQTQTTKLKVVPKFGLQFFYSKNGRKFLENFKGRVLIVCESQGRQSVLTDLLSSYQLSAVNCDHWIDFLEQKEKLCITNASLSDGILCDQFAIITENNLFGKDVVKQQRRRRAKHKDFDEAIKLADRIAIMKDGIIEQLDTPANIVLNPATEYVRKFTEEVPREKVLLIEDVMDAPTSDNLSDLKVSKDEIIENVAEKILTQEKTVAVIDGKNQIVGSISPSKIINTVFGGRKHSN